MPGSHTGEALDGWMNSSPVIKASKVEDPFLRSIP
jgi:hypothetical protein